MWRCYCWINTNCERIIFIDNDLNVIGLLKFLAKIPFDNLIKELEFFIERYGLSYSAQKGYSNYKKQITDSNFNNGLKQYNSKGYYELRAYYNSISNKHTNQAYNLLYLLMLYAFNNDIRFSHSGEFNLPAGKTDLNKINIKKLKSFRNRLSTIEAKFICGDFKHARIKEIIKNDDFIYMNSPYLITNAVYNESGKWNERNEYEILKFMNYCLDNNKFFFV